MGVTLCWVAACGADESTSPASGSGAAAGAGGVASGGSAGGASVVCELGTMYPGEPLIDPDAPVFDDANWSQAKVSDAFAKAKLDGAKPYLAYKAARDSAKVLDCAFCNCGCAPGIGHKSAIDCFKDMHGFT